MGNLNHFGETRSKWQRLKEDRQREMELQRTGSEPLISATSVVCDSGHNLRHRGKENTQEIVWGNLEAGRPQTNHQHTQKGVTSNWG